MKDRMSPSVGTDFGRRFLANEHAPQRLRFLSISGERCRQG
jgi:hypothetical protein